MKHLCCVKFLFLFFILVGSVFGDEVKKSAIVYYGDNISYSIVGIHDYIIVQPENVNTYNHGFKLYRDKIYAYLSVGEVEKTRGYYKGIKKSWIIGKNSSWKSEVVDISNKNYRNFLLDSVVEPLHKKGFKNLFLDTLDSYNLVSTGSKFKREQQEGLIEFISELKNRYPDMKIIINRGFEIVDKVHNHIEALLFESIFNGLSSNLKFKKVSTKDREWLLKQVDKAKFYDIPVIALDYIPKEKRKRVKDYLEEIERLGLIPYISFSKDLDSYGFSSKTPIKREILLLYDDTQFDGTKGDDKVFSTAFLQLSLPVEYLGYIPILEPISEFKANSKNLERFAGAIIWINGKFADKNPKKFTKILKNIYFSNVKMLILQSLKFKHRQLLKLLGIRMLKANIPRESKVVCKKGYVGFEIEPFVPDYGILYKVVDSKYICELRTNRDKGALWAITNWGGFISDGVLMTSLNRDNLWIVNPFKLIKESLRLKDFPIPDPTTENGKRLFFSHLDGDAIMSKAEWDSDKFDAEVIYEEILKKYDLPLSVSIIEGEVAPYGLYPDISPKLEEIAKKIFKLPNVEGATHTFSHPFFWGEVRKNRLLDDKHRLKVKNYDNFSIDREIGGSLKYINEKLMPPGKKAKTIFWSGDCLPRANALEYVHKNNILNMNGGDTTIVDKTPWISLIAPLGVKRGDYYQVHTGEQDENVYNQNWSGTFWGFRRAIQTYKLTNAPRRFKPIDIYYHFYSGSKKASLNALKELFDWAIAQDVMPIYTTSYIPKVLDFFYASVSKIKNKTFFVAGMKNLKTLRVKKSWFVDFEKSINVVGAKKYLNSRYIHLSPESDKAKIVFVDRDTKDNYLLSSNGVVKSYEKRGENISVTFKSFVPLKVEYHLKNNCYLEETPKADKKEMKDSIVRLRYEKKREANIKIQCR